VVIPRELRLGKHVSHWLPVFLVVLGIPSSRASAQGIGEVALYGGWAKGSGGGLPASFMTGASLAFVRGSFSLGPELHFSTGGDRKLVAWGGVARLNFGAGSLRPYLVGGLGSYSWKQLNAVTITAFSGSIGAGVVLGDPKGPVAFQAELRRHDKLQNIGTTGSLGLFSATAGVRFHW
jgi:hypothetical protein